VISVGRIPGRAQPGLHVADAAQVAFEVLPQTMMPAAAVHLQVQKPGQQIAAVQPHRSAAPGGIVTMAAFDPDMALWPRFCAIEDPARR
jgi:hypothetical protein